MITRVSVEVAKVRVLCQPFKHLVDEGKREVIFLGCLVKHPVIDTHYPSGHYLLRYELVPLIPDYRHASLLRDYLDWADPLAVLHGVYDARVQQLEYLFVVYLPHRIIMPPLMFS